MPATSSSTTILTASHQVNPLHTHPSRLTSRITQPIQLQNLHSKDYLSPFHITSVTQVHPTACCLNVCNQNRLPAFFLHHAQPTSSSNSSQRRPKRKSAPPSSQNAFQRSPHQSS
ncbi:hypothetical protein KC19_VG012200 [Ceratodon purpureus]|uniref:Uncharacterized protein n=1 Tax=Ceratodon purpureus TaxID=3225 RepID=A0A8T0HKV7_CERPU|nr:hypothetical protein KC19_VG012200 [Ceratodon purpureus]